MDLFQSDIHQVFVKLLDGKHKILNFGEPSIPVSALKSRIETLTSIPSGLQRLVLQNSNILRDDQFLNITQPNEKLQIFKTLGPDSSGQLDGEEDCNLGGSAVANRPRKFPVIVHLLLRLRGGKGGFGSLLRGAATKAGQKKTNNFDACRDMNGRRLRHVNAEKRLEEWRAETEERKLEKMAEEFIKKKTKEIVKSGKGKGGDSTEKYVAKYREDSAKCMEEVERSVRESVQQQKLLSSKRKKDLAKGIESAPKRLKIWFGKRKVGDSDSDEDDMDEEGSDKEEEGENEKSVIDNGSHSDSSKEAETSTGSIPCKEHVTESVDQGSSESGSDEVRNVAEYPLNLNKSSEDESSEQENTQVLDYVEKNGVCNEVVYELPQRSLTEVKNSVLEPVHEDPPISVSSDLQSSEKPLNFDEYHSAAELEVLGMERLKSELQTRGLKCGGTLQERAARLFLLKTTPLEMLPKKLFAKK
ncbi:uncharacterized protein LOC127261201 [Andrographis paniculata]|uniref:uncharacterized protein LOC127261201 n=1 Tax=Andrographis paniculata TaxID=175694 RepID=UPI0021E6E5D6|nr:uncharacterized protein LOC127261201 [Andrographis paniculata]